MDTYPGLDRESDKYHPPFFFQAVEFTRLRRNERMAKQNYKGLAKGSECEKSTDANNRAAIVHRGI